MKNAAKATTFASIFITALCMLGNAGGAEIQAKVSLQEELAKLKIPPAWFDTVTVKWDMNKPWKDARLEVRRLLAQGGDTAREGVKLTWLYAQKKDIGDGHEMSMYLFLSGNYAWALQEYAKYIQTVAGKGATHPYLCYASCYAHFGEYAKSLEILNAALKDLPANQWRNSSLANIKNQMGDVYAKMGDLAKAKESYAESIRLYPMSEQPYGRHLLPRQAKKVQDKLDRLTMQSLQDATLRDGTYTGKALGYADSKEMEVLVTITNGKIADIKVKHEEKIELGATKSIPKLITEKQSLQVDAVTGATVTSQAIIDGAYQALKQAGLK